MVKSIVIVHVDGFSYAWGCVKTFIKYRVMQYEIFYDPKFDISIGESHPYTAKFFKEYFNGWLSKSC